MSNYEQLNRDIKQLEKALLEKDELIQKLKKKVTLYQKFVPLKNNKKILRDEFQGLTSGHALQKLLDDYEFQTVLDVGAGGLSHSKIFATYGKKVTAIDFGKSIYYRKSEYHNLQNIKKIFCDFNSLKLDEQFDLLWLSHVLEHQLNVGEFLDQVVKLTKDNGIIAITVPPLKHQIVGGHVSLWNAGLILYRLVLAGVDCKNASILSYGYNISVIVRKKAIFFKDLDFDAGDIRRLKQYFPTNLNFATNELDDPFDGNIKELNW